MKLSSQIQQPIVIYKEQDFNYVEQLCLKKDKKKFQEYIRSGKEIQNGFMNF